MKNNILISIITLLFFFLPSAFAEETIEIHIYPDEVVNSHFYGFGAETLPWLWTKENKEVGVNEEDIKLNIGRIKDMELPITRIFVPWETWNPSVDYKSFTWESDEMRSLYKMLEIYQEMGTKVILVTVDWLEESPWINTKASSNAVLELLEYLIKDKGYSCIKFWTLTNEPELTYGWLKKMPFENYVEIHRLVKRGSREKGLSVKVIASDEVESAEWFDRSVASLYNTADIFSSHRYFHPSEMNVVPKFFRERLNALKDIPFFLCEFGFRGPDFGVRTNSLMQEYEYGLYTADLCIEVLNLGVDAASLWCLHEIRLIDEINPEGGKLMRIGLWAFKDEDWQTFPVFEIYRFFTKYIRSGSKVLDVEIEPSGILKAACVEYRKDYSLIILNMTKKKQRFSIDGLKLGQDFKKYVYTRHKFQAQKNGYLNIEAPPESVIFYTNLK